MDVDSYKPTTPYSKDTRKAYMLEQGALNKKFLHDCAEDCGVSLTHPKFAKLCNLAWEYGHSDGLESVYWHFSEMSELLASH